MIKIITNQKYQDLILQIKELDIESKECEREKSRLRKKISIVESQNSSLNKDYQLLQQNYDYIKEDYKRQLEILDSYILKFNQEKANVRKLIAKIGGLTKELNKLKLEISHKEEIISNYKQDALNRKKKNPIDYIENNKKVMIINEQNRNN